MLGLYWFMEGLWFLLYIGAFFAIETGTDITDGLIHQTAIGLSFAHMLMWAAVLYAMDAKARPIIAIAFLGVIATDVESTLHAALHLWQTIPAYYWAFAVNLTVSSFGLFISMYALLCYVIHIYEHMGKTESTNRYEKIND